jgi:hypothetical protein
MKLLKKLAKPTSLNNNVGNNTILRRRRWYVSGKTKI